MASLEQVFEGDLKGSHYSIEHDLSPFIWPLASIVQRILVPLRTSLTTSQNKTVCFLTYTPLQL